MKTVDIRKLSDDELLAKLMDARENLMRLRFRLASGELTDHTQMSRGRQDIARFLTVLRERELETAEENNS
ncbi:MAG: 50S ribosomal protein L29 [Kiloniellales bacterium]|nr:50S ribosomal protein L29 [Kiloniellales bacterium]